MRILSPAKLAYLSRNLQDWCDYHGIKGFRFPSNFPLRTVLPMRVLLANDKADDRLQAILCKLISKINAIFLVWKFFLI
jgi:2-hydroxychromene-2-carboxylate isomerase